MGAQCARGLARFEYSPARTDLQLAERALALPQLLPDSSTATPSADCRHDPFFVMCVASDATCRAALVVAVAVAGWGK